MTTQSRQRSKLDPCFMGASSKRRKATNATSSGASIGAQEYSAGATKQKGSKHKRQRNCHPTILSHGMFHRHPSLSIEHFHFPSLSDSNPFPWLNSDSQDSVRESGRRRRERKDSVFLSSSWDSVIDKHLCSSSAGGGGACCGTARKLQGRGLNYLRLNEEDDVIEYEDDDVFDLQQQQQLKQQVTHQMQESRRGSRDPRWREAIAEAVRRDFDAAAKRRDHFAGLCIRIDPPATARRRLQRLLGDDRNYCVAGRPVVSLCDKEYTRRLSSALDRQAESKQLEREAKLAEAERLRQLRLI